MDVRVGLAQARLRVAVEHARRRPRRRVWVTDVLQRRKARGEFYHLVQELRLLDPDRHQTYFRMSRDSFDLILSKIGPIITRQHTNFREPIEPAQRLAITLRYLASGMEFAALAPTYRLGERTVRAIVWDTCAAIVAVLGPEVLPAPTEATWRRSEAAFNQLWDFPNCVAAIDGKHVLIKAPANSGSEYFSYKKTFSTVLLAAVDGNYRFVYVSVGSAGRESDGGIFGRSDLAEKLRDGTLGLPPAKPLPGTEVTLPHVFVADEAFPLTANIMRPYPGRTEARLGRPAAVFNYRLSRARRVVENAFGIMSQMWRLLTRPLNVSVDHACQLVYTICILHNFLRRDDAAGAPPRVDGTEAEQANGGGGGALVDLRGRLAAHPHNYPVRAEQIRQQFTHFFMGPGAVPWQE
ncbi:protein ALP1-like [Amphibalanus amphitrite]|uniref:protein ALP1-like n=1 Tax=Amphibalanus amphitrite TaxID=1232801 RepID=UPI001C9150CF|nr:protein ALP1-like [Amphibalanus amphitrite]